MPRSRRPPSLPRLLADLLAEADLRGETAEKRLEHGAILKARSRLAEVEGGRVRRRQLLISRAGVEPGDVELATFRRDGRVPEHAEEARYWRERDDRHTVTYTWDAPAIALPLDDLPAGL